MSPEQHRIRSEQLLRSLLSAKARIRPKVGATDWPVYPGGDQRKRILFWVNCADVQPLMDDGLLAETRQGIGLSEETQRKLLHGSSARELVETTIFDPNGDEQTVKRNIRSSVILRLAARKDRGGDVLLTAAQITAAQRYTMDMLKSGEGHVSSIDLSSPKVDGTRRFDRAERASINRLDGHRNLRAAREAIGDDLSRLMNAVCGANERLEAIERLERWSRGTGLNMLKIALDLLSRHYGTVAGQSHDRDAERRESDGLKPGMGKKAG